MGKKIKKPNKSQKEKVRELAKKHFITLKIKEILYILVSLNILIFIPYWTGRLILINSVCDFHEPTDFFGEPTNYIAGCQLTEFWLMGLLWFVIIGVSLVILYFLIRGWIKSNWKMAYEKAEKEVGVDSDPPWYSGIYKHYKKVYSK